MVCYFGLYNAQSVPLCIQSCCCCHLGCFLSLPLCELCNSLAPALLTLNMYIFIPSPSLTFHFPPPSPASTISVPCFCTTSLHLCCYVNSCLFFSACASLILCLFSALCLNFICLYTLLYIISITCHCSKIHLTYQLFPTSCSPGIQLDSNRCTHYLP